MTQTPWTLLLWSLLAIGSLLRGQPLPLRFLEYESLENLDCTSYPSQMMLRHQVGPFYKLPKNPVFRPSRSGWDRQDVADPLVWVTPSRIQMFYDGSAGEQYRIGVAVLDSTGWFWERPSAPLPVDSREGWDDYHVIAPFVMNQEGELLLYYSGNGRDGELGYRLGRAVQRGTGWETIPPRPLHQPEAGEWDRDGCSYASVIYDPMRGRYRMYYSGFRGVSASIGLLESADGVHWVPWEKNPVLAIPPGVIAPFVLFDGRYYWMYYVQLEFSRGFRTSIYRVRSEDGVSWRAPEMILTPEARWEGNRLMRPAIAFFDQRVHLFYGAQRGSRWRIGEAVATVRFQRQGTWRSRALNKTISHVRIVYQLPRGTALELQYLDARGNHRVPLNEGKTHPAFRKDIRVQFVPLPQEGLVPPYRLELHFRTSRPDRTPVVYQVVLIP